MIELILVTDYYLEGKERQPHLAILEKNKEGFRKEQQTMCKP